MRKLAPAETLVWLETNDLSKMLQALTDNSAFNELAEGKTDFPEFENIQVAVAITGFETSEQQVTNEQSILNFKPHFVAVADTHSWEWQNRRLVEEKIGTFVSKNYGEQVNLKSFDKNGGKWFVWTTDGGRKIFAFVQSSQIFFGNDESAIEKCLAVKRGEADSLMKNGNLARFAKADNILSFGYISPEGIANIANLAGISTAIKATEDENGRNFIARVLPQILQKTTKDISWTAAKTAQGIEDTVFISLNAETASVFKETLSAALPPPAADSAEFLPADVWAVTRYNLQNPKIAWRSLLLICAKNTDALSGKLLANFSNSLLEPYGISDAETFLSEIDSQIFTAQFDAQGEKTVVVVSVKDAENIKKSIAAIDFKAQSESAEIWKSKDGDITAAFVKNKLILGDGESVSRCLQAKQSGQNFTKTANFQKIAETESVAITFAKDTESAKIIVGILAQMKDENKKSTTHYLTETLFTDKGVERKTVSDFGLLGTILEQFDN